jgi:hypothetical protein
VNLAGNYDYLEQPYYVSQDRELAGEPIHPTNKEMLDAYVPPLFLEKAKVSGLSVPRYYISNGYFEPPVIIDPINPFMIKSRTVWKAARTRAVAKSMTRNFTYAICCQEIPAGARIRKARVIFGHTSIARYREAVRCIWDVFHIPLAVVRLMELTDGSLLLSDVSQLPYDSLRSRERDFIEERVSWES